ncbi:hypothetical protein AVEN_207970-1 [Araneus ventricosus]|uniref:Uncharacterized protein n=1 Tax=Araneus ventricosus TaxID=182803 RepID=A0A4Y2V6P9_ARAVE|nr:hypothetical protein AVEN_207970-1 [Araneus ventricosus]
MQRSEHLVLWYAPRWKSILIQSCSSVSISVSRAKHEVYIGNLGVRAATHSDSTTMRKPHVPPLKVAYSSTLLFLTMVSFLKAISDGQRRVSDFRVH